MENQILNVKNYIVKSEYFGKQITGIANIETNKIGGLEVSVETEINDPILRRDINKEVFDEINKGLNEKYGLIVNFHLYSPSLKYNHNKDN